MKNLSKYILKINGKYVVDFIETENKRGRGAYCNGAFNLHSCLSADEVVVSEDIRDAQIIEGRINLRSYIEKIIKNDEYTFKTLEIIEVGEKE